VKVQEEPQNLALPRRVADVCILTPCKGRSTGRPLMCKGGQETVACGAERFERDRDTSDRIARMHEAGQAQHIALQQLATAARVAAGGIGGAVAHVPRPTPRSGHRFSLVCPIGGPSC
jgi:hypothetical protein